jgi:N utilization substance protein A
MNYEMMEALSQIARDKNVDRRMVVETLQAGLLSAAKKRYGAADNIDVEVDKDSGRITVFALKTVVELVSDPMAEINLEDAREIEKKSKLGDEVKKELSIESFGRSAIQAAKQIVVQRIKEAEREKIYNEFIDRIGELVTGTVQQVDRGNLMVNIGRIESIVPVKEQIRREKYYRGNTIRAVITDVMKTAKGPQVVLSRTHPNLVKELFEIEVPEIGEEIIEIKGVAREAGERSKIAVHSHDRNVDCVGACVGMKGTRVQSVVRELGGERIDIIPWSEEPEVFVAKSLAPAKIEKIEMLEAQGRMVVVVSDDQLSLAIGKSGINARLASKLTGWKLDLLDQEQYAEQKAGSREAAADVQEISGVGEKMAERLVEAGFASAAAVAAAGADDLSEVPGIGVKTALRLIDDAKKIIAA